jgi:hypothetical protein
MTRWEYARLESTERGINVVFTHRQAWTGITPESFFQTLGRLGDEGWELVAALPLTAMAAGVPVPASAPAGAGTSVSAGAGVADSRDARDSRDPRERAAPPSAAALQLPQNVTLQVTPDRWLVFKRPQPEPAPEQSSQGADIIKGVVGRQLLKGRLPLP